MKSKNIFLIIQPILITVILSILLTIHIYMEAGLSYRLIPSVALFLGHTSLYIFFVYKKAIMVRSASHIVFMSAIVLLGLFSQAFVAYDFFLNALCGLGFIVSAGIELHSVKRLLKNSDFESNFNTKPSMYIYVNNDLELLYKWKLSKPPKFSSDFFTYLNNDIEFDKKGVKNTDLSYDIVKNYLNTSLLTIQNFGKDDLKTLEMLQYQ